MKTADPGFSRERIDERLATSGFRFTRQRQSVYEVLLGKRDHPTAEDVFLRAKRAMPEISLATVYNCLDALVKSGLVKLVTVERGASRFCPNMHEHGHFHCEQCGMLFDISLEARRPIIPIPRGFRARQIELSVHGLCPGCRDKNRD